MRASNAKKLTIGQVTSPRQVRDTLAFRADIKRKVLVLGCDDRSGLAVVRSLGRAGFEVHVGWVTSALVLKSRYAQKFVDMPDPVDDSWVDRFREIGATEGYTLVVPCDDRAIIPTQIHRDAITRWTTLYCLSEESFRATFDKYQTTMIASQCGISLPHWMLLQSERDFLECPHKIGFPLVLKPISSFDLIHGGRRREVRVVLDQSDYELMSRQMLAKGPLLAQSWFPGIGVGIELLAKDGNILVAFQHERVHEPPRGGGSSYRRSTALNEELFRAAASFVSALHYTGVMMMEFRVDRQTKKWILVETNGRFWGSLPLAVAAGVDFPLYLAEMLLKDRNEFPKRYKIGLYSRNLTLDVRWFNQNRKADTADVTQTKLRSAQILSEFKNLIFLSERVDSFAFDDPMPFVFEILELAKKINAKLLAIVKVRSGYSSLSKWMRLRRRRRLIENARSVLFVCYGNICRSPFAEAYAQSLVPGGITFASAGSYFEANRTSPLMAQDSAKSFGVELTAHRSRPLTKELVAKADVIFVFDRINWTDVVKHYPNAKERIVGLSDFLDDGPDEIFDPYGQSLDRFEKCYALIARSISIIVSSYWKKRIE